MKQLIVTADDFGYSRNVNKAIIECFRRGIVTSTSLLVNTKYFDESVELLRQNKKLDVGIHINLTEFKPLTSSKTLEKNGYFIGKEQWYNRYFNTADEKEIEFELEEQLLKAISSGLDITHLDGHNHIHVFPRIIDIVLRLARKHKVKWIRLPYEKSSSKIKPYRASPKRLHSRKEVLAKINSHNLEASKYFFGGYFSEAASIRELLNILESLGNGVNELMVHPAYADAKGDKFHVSKQRENEIRLLTSSKIKSFIQENKIILTSFLEVK